MDGSLKIKRPSTARWEFAEYILFDCYKTGYVTVTVIFQFSVAFKAFHIFFCFLNYELCNEEKKRSKENVCIRRILVTETYCQGRVFFFLLLLFYGPLKIIICMQAQQIVF